jgi:hypothetical protein
MQLWNLGYGTTEVVSQSCIRILIPWSSWSCGEYFKNIFFLSYAAPWSSIFRLFWFMWQPYCHSRKNEVLYVTKVHVCFVALQFVSDIMNIRVRKKSSSTHQGRLLSWWGLQRGLSCFSPLPKLRPVLCLISSYLLLSSSHLAPLFAEHLPHHHHNRHVTLVWICHGCGAFTTAVFVVVVVLGLRIS